MRIHSDKLTTSDLHTASRESGVSIIHLSETGSRSRARRYDVILSGSSPHVGQHDGESPAATWDEWGTFLATLFSIDPSTKAGRYDGQKNFISITCDDYNRNKLASKRYQRPCMTAPWLSHN